MQKIEASSVLLHVYHVSKNDAVRRLNRITGGSRNPLKFGGVFHAGVEIYGKEWSYGATLEPSDCGVEWNVPKEHSMHQYYSTVHLGDTSLNPHQVHAILSNLVEEWPGGEYDLVHHNCCHFADAFSVALGMGNIPRWVNRFARTADRGERLKDKTKDGIRELKNGLRGLFGAPPKEKQSSSSSSGPLLASQLPHTPT